jgi:hypothetical protein
LEGWQVRFCGAHALGQDNAKAVEERGLCGVGLSDAAQADLAMRGGQDDVVRLNARKLFEDAPGSRPRSSRRSAAPGFCLHQVPLPPSFVRCEYVNLQWAAQ